MIRNPEKKISNDSLLHDHIDASRTNSVSSLVAAIGIDRPLRDTDEVGVAAEMLDKMLYFLSFSLIHSDSLPNQVEKYLCAAGELAQACHLLSLRIDQYMETHGTYNQYQE